MVDDYTPSIDELCGVYASGADDPLLAAAEFHRAIADLRAEAWDEGYTAGDYDATTQSWMLDAEPGAINPYRQAYTETTTNETKED